jgi:hypothetical protein
MIDKSVLVRCLQNLRERESAYTSRRPENMSRSLGHLQAACNRGLECSAVQRLQEAGIYLFDGPI